MDYIQIISASGVGAILGGILNTVCNTNAGVCDGGVLICLAG